MQKVGPIGWQLIISNTSLDETNTFDWRLCCKSNESLAVASDKSERASQATLTIATTKRNIWDSLICPISYHT